nr:cupin domain-containing protein [Lachnospiraceae bacterium]
RNLKPVSDQGRQVSPNTIRYGKELFSGIENVSIDKCLLEQTDRMSVVRLRCNWQDISDFAAYEKYTKALYENAGAAGTNRTETEGPEIIKNCRDVTVLNRTTDHLVVANDLENLLIVNTADATYISSKENADDIRDIVQDNAESYDAYFNYGPVGYRPWGTREIIHKSPGYRVRRIMLYPGASLSMHSHEKRNENYSVVTGVLSIELENRQVKLHQGDGINILPGMMHRLYNDTDLPVIAIEVDTGAEIEERDMVHRDSETESVLPSLYRLRPAYKDYLWGGDRLKTVYKKPTPYEITAESWELSAHPAGPSQIVDAEGGEFSDMSFLEFIEKHGPEVMGWKSRIFDRFPILIKFIDAKKSLSVQIHPDDDYAFVKEGEFGKNEVWYVMDAAPGSYLYCGLKQATPKEEIRRRIEDHTITDILNKVEVKVGDVVFIPAGTIHAIGEGIFICEIQQSSNCTYRVYDFGRLDKNGKPRELHIEKALDVVDTEAYEQNAYGLSEPYREGDATIQTLCRCKYFESTKYIVDGEITLKMDDASFRSIVILKGDAVISTGDESMTAAPGESFFISAGRKVVHITGKCEIIVTNI